MSVDEHVSGPAAPSGERQCPKCDQVSAVDAKICWLCGYDFVTGQMSSDERDGQGHTELRVVDVAAPPAVQPPTLTAVSAGADDHLQAAQSETDKEGLSQTGTVPPPTKAGVRSGLLQEATATELGDFGDDIFTTDASGQTKAEVAAAAPAAPKMGIEPSALSIPEYTLEHPTSPHIILFVDFEFRRSRAAVSVTPPEPREPKLIVLTDTVQQFGRTIATFSLNFDVATEVVHGYFIKEENRKDYSIVDLKSRNGIKVNGIYVQSGLPKPLKEGDVITLGLWTKMVYYGGNDATTNQRN
jgi:hypothetical protein